MVTEIASKLMYAVMDIFCIGIIILMLTKNHMNGKLFKLHQLFNRTGVILAVILAADLLTWFVNGVDNGFAYVMNFLSNEVYFLTVPFLSYAWHKYSEEKIGWNEVKLIKGYKVLCTIPKLCVIVNVLVIAENFLTQSTFYISRWDNVYHRGHFFYVSVVMFFISVASTLIMTILSIDRKNHKDRVDKTYLCAFMAAPAVCSILQFCIEGVNINFVACTFSLLMVFINVQTEQITIDYLTGVNNRRAFDVYLYGKARDGDVSTLFLMFIDVNHFKTINDKYGHLEGDEALAKVASILKKCLRNGDFLARMGGDEFGILGYGIGQKDVESRIKVINEELAAYNAESDKEYELSLSIGYAYYKKGEDKQAALRKLIDNADADMYRRRSVAE